MGDLVIPAHCVRCKRQIQPDAQFCPYCGQSQRPAQEEVIDVELVGEPAPLPMVPPAVSAAPITVHVHQPSGTSPALGAAVGGAVGAFSAIVLLTPPLGCITIPLILVAATFVILGLVGAATAATSMIVGAVQAYWPAAVCGLPAVLVWMAAQQRAGDDRRNMATAAIGLAVIGAAGVAINAVVMARR